ncbi:MAG TPA: aspartate kinase [Gammaproteobacteria bacterium]|nr:aspartate kinase [Gammaproteobacteria bacterium]
MALLVQKYGGTSVGSLERIHAVADKIAAARRAGDDIVVVVSAMAGETDHLLGLAHTLCDRHHPNARELDVLLATGEQITIALLAMALEMRQLTARSWTGAQAGIITDNTHTRARIQRLEVAALRTDLAAGRIPIVAGFQGATADGLITTLGRGGSDTTAVALAAALGADECQIYTDVDGIYTTDPNRVPQARKLAQVDFETMLALAASGSKVLQARAVEMAGKHRVPLRVLSAFEPGSGTIINYDVNDGATMERAALTGIATTSDESFVTVRGLGADPAESARLLALLAAANVDVDMLVQQSNGEPDNQRLDMAFSVPRCDYQQVCELLAQHPGVIISGSPRVAKLSLVGIGVKSHAGIIARLFGTLAKCGIQARLIATSEIRISVLMDEEQLESAVQAVHQAFALEREDSRWRGDSSQTVGSL